MHMALLATFFGPSGWFSCVLGRSGLDFGRVRVAPGMVLEPQQPITQCFYTLLRERRTNAPTLRKHWQEWYETHIGARARYDTSVKNR